MWNVEKTKDFALKILLRLMPVFLIMALVDPDASAQGYPLGALTLPVRGKPMRASSGLFDPESNRDAHHVKAGQQRVLADLNGPGEIRHIWFTIASRDRRYPRSLVLRIYYDGAPSPSVETPIGDFFAAGNGMRANVHSLPIEVTSYGRALNSYWRMPFRKRIRIEVHNQGTERMTVYFQCDWLKVDALPEDTLYFHARYHHEYPPKPFTVYTVFDCKGEGQYVGTVLSSQNTVGSWFGEADDRVYVDGEEVPSIVGTGLEDYFNDSWNLRLFSYLRRGVTICETKGEERRICAYRWHLEDPIPFTRSLRMEIERRSYVYVVDPGTGKKISHRFKFRPDYFSSVSFWYHKGIAEPWCELPPVEERIPHEVWIEVSRMANKVKAAPGLKPRRASNRTCNLKKYFYLRNDEPGGWVEFPVALDRAGRYSISIFQALFRNFGIWRVTLRGEGVDRVLHPALDFWDYMQARAENWPENYHHGTVEEKKVGLLHLEAGSYVVRFDCVGANPLSRHPDTLEYGKGCSLGLDAILFRRMPVNDPYVWLMDYLREEKALFERKDREAAVGVANLSAAVEAFHRDTGAYPHALSELLVQPDRLRGAPGKWPYLDASRVPLDPWSQPYRYRAPGEANPWRFDVYSVHGRSRNPMTWIGNWKSPFELQGAIEGEDLKITRSSPGVRGAVQRVSSYGKAPVSGRRQLFIRLAGNGAWAEMEIPPEVPPGRYEVRLAAVTSWDYGKVQWRLNGQPLGGAFDGYSPDIERRTLDPTEVNLPAGKNTLRVESIGKNPVATGHYAGLDALVMRRVP